MREQDAQILDGRDQVILDLLTPEPTPASSLEMMIVGRIDKEKGQRKGNKEKGKGEKREMGRGSPADRQKRLRNFKWSSYRGYAGLGAPFPFVQEAMVSDELRGPRRAERLRYRRFVEEGLVREIENPFEAVRWQAVLGSESFVQKLRDRIKGLYKQRREITSLRKAMPSIDPDKVLERIAKKYQVNRKRLVARGERGLHAKNVAMWMIWETGSKSLREIGELFGGLDYAAVAQRIRRTRSNHNAVAARKLIRTMLNV